MLVLIRHAHAGSKQGWDGPDEQRPLSARGHRQSLSLAESLSELNLRTLWSSPTARCRQTLEPLAALIGIPLEDHPLLLPDADVAELRCFLAGLTGRGDVAVCGHGESLGRLLTCWTSGAAASAGSPAHTAKGGVWLVDGPPGPDPILRYLPPDGGPALPLDRGGER